ncbi:DsrE family protein [Marinicella rhabdoformis]|uniref:DsrE family protein n=1 Tax=Marinicella rhabdoformis TaxID=2580566 RepID=UPI0012AEB20A|nr:DsrE family protein [Marinicella rhabdoformis]
MKLCKYFLVLFAVCVSSFVWAQNDHFHAGKVIPEFGKIAEVEDMEALPENAQFKVSFDVAKQAKAGEVNRSFDTVARFINMHHAAGVKKEHINLAVVVHGGAVKDLTSDTYYQAKQKVENKNKALIKALHEQGVTFYVCGQSAAYYGVNQSDLLPGVKLSLSAMTAHALLQQKGFTVNPF